MNFESSQDRKEKSFATFAERALKRFGDKQSYPWPELRNKGGSAARGGETGRGNLAAPVCGLMWIGDGQSRDTHGDQGAAA